MKRTSSGFTLLETVIYIGLLVVILPAFTMFVLNIWKQYIEFDARAELEQTTSMIFLELTNAITEADAIVLSTSTLGTDTSILKFQDSSGTQVTIDLVTTTISFSGTNQTVHRLRLQHGADAAVWLTEPEQDVTQWRVDAVRNSAGTLTGLRFDLDATLLNAGGKTYRNATFAGDTTVSLSPSTTSL